MSARSQTHIAYLVASMSCVNFIAPDAAYGADARPIEEVIVTAQKRSERLQDVPVPVTSISVEELTSSSQSLLRDYYTHVPGLNVTTWHTVQSDAVHPRNNDRIRESHRRRDDR